MSEFNFRFFDKNGREIEVTDFTRFFQLVKSGDLQDDTLLYYEENDLLKRASDLPEFQIVVESLRNQIPLETAQRQLETSGILPKSALTTEDSTSKQSRNQLVIIASVLLLAISIGPMIFLVPYGITPEQIGSIAGLSVSMGLLSVLLRKYLFKGRKGLGLLCFSVLFFCCSTVMVMIRLNVARQDKAAAKLLAATVNDVVSGKELDNTDLNRATYGDSAPFLELTRDYLRQAQRDYKHFSEELQKHDIERILLKDTLNSAQTIAIAQKDLEVVSEILNQYEGLVTRRVDEVVTNVRELPVSENLKAEFLSGFERARTKMLEPLMVERSAISEINSFFRFMKSRAGKFGFQGEVIRFDSSDDAETYNQYVVKIKNLLEQEYALSETRQNEALKAIREFEDKSK